MRRGHAQFRTGSNYRDRLSRLQKRMSSITPRRGRRNTRTPEERGEFIDVTGIPGAGAVIRGAPERGGYVAEFVREMRSENVFRERDPRFEVLRRPMARIWFQ
jgi:hypothetical protein